VTLKHRGREWIGLRLSVVSNQYTYPLYAEIERRHGLLRDEAAVVVCLSLREGATAQDIVEYTARPKNTISRAVRKLESQMIIRRESDIRDARAARLYLTDDGQKLFEAIKDHYAERDRRMTGALNKEEQREFDRLLMKISDTSKVWA
jgi:DNA-binding MarR family transcriptional regulator